MKKVLFLLGIFIVVTGLLSLSAHALILAANLESSYARTNDFLTFHYKAALIFGPLLIVLAKLVF